MKVQSLYLYPVKSLAGIEVSSFELDDFGPQGDRRWMIVDDQNRFVTQRQLPKLALVRTRMHNGHVDIMVPGHGTFPLSAGPGQVRVVVWQDAVDALTGNPDASSALSAFCGARLRRSEEHTSELQSRPHLVCRLLLEKKKMRASVCGARTDEPAGAR